MTAFLRALRRVSQYRMKTRYPFFLTYCGRGRLVVGLLVLAWGFPATLCKAGDTSEKERESIGYVLDSTGEWTQNGIKFLHKRGDPVYAGGIISLDPSYKEAQTRGAAITIILFNGNRVERSFEPEANFPKAIELPMSLGEQNSQIERLLRAVGGLFSRRPEKIYTRQYAVLSCWSCMRQLSNSRMARLTLPRFSKALPPVIISSDCVPSILRRPGNERKGPSLWLSIGKL